MDRLGAEIGIKSPVDWYKVRAHSIPALRNLIRRKELSLAEILGLSYPEHRWEVWRFHRTPNQYWASTSNRTVFLDWALEQLRPVAAHGASLERWYGITAKEVIGIGGRTLILDEYKGSLQAALRATYPQFKFIEWKFKGAPTNFWDSVENRRAFFIHLMRNELRLDLASTSDWYHITTEHVDRAGGTGVLRHYQHSASLAVMELFPQHKWQPWRFKRCHVGFWDAEDNQRAFLLDWISPRSLPPQDASGSVPATETMRMESFYSIPNKLIISHGGSALLRRYEFSVPLMCRTLFPTHPWDNSKFSKNSAWKPPNTES